MKDLLSTGRKLWPILKILLQTYKQTDIASITCPNIRASRGMNNMSSISGQDVQGSLNTCTSIRLCQFFVAQMYLNLFHSECIASCFISSVYLKVGSHYERLYQRLPAFEKSKKWAQTSAKLRSREGYFSFTLPTFYIRRKSTFTNVSQRLTAFASAWQRLPACYLFSISVSELLPTQIAYVQRSPT